MFKTINKIDFLSPPITLFHLERRTHTSRVGGFFVLIMVGICSIYIIFLLYNLNGHKKLTSLFHKKFELEAGYFSFNSSSIFHFIQIFSPEDGGYFDKYDSKYIRAYITYVHSNFSYGNLYLFDHWVFDTCRKDIDDKDLEPYLLENVENFTNGVCIRHYYNSTERKYYSLEEEGFSWPYLQHGTAHRNNIYLTTIIQKCSNDSIINEIFGLCPSQKEIDDYVNKYFAIYLYFTDIQVDPYNYSNPVQKYLQIISSSIGTHQTFVENYLHYSPLRIKTTLGSILGRGYDINSFYFDFNRKGAANNNGEKYFTITRYYHLMQNNVQIYERKYNNLFDIMSEIGGVIQFIFYVFYWINFFYNKYIIAYDTNSLFFAIKDNQSFIKDNNKQIKENNHLINIKNFSIKEPLNKNFRSSKFLIYKNNIDINNTIFNESFKIKNKSIHGSENENYKNESMKKKLNNIINNKNYDYYFNEKEEKRKSPSNKNKTNFNTNNNSSNIFLRENSNLIINKLKRSKNSFKTYDINQEKKNKKRKKSNKDYYNKIMLSKKSIGKIEHIKKETLDNKDEKLKSLKYFSLLDFLKSILFKREKESHNFLRIFRKHLLSEEHLLKTHIKIIFLENHYNFRGEENINFSNCFEEL